VKTLRPIRRSSSRFRRPAARVLLILAPFVVAPVLAWETCGFRGCPEVGSLRYYQPGGAPVLLDRSGVAFGDLAPPERKIVRLDEMPRHLAEAFLAVEDQKFFEHNAIDWGRVAGAALANLRRGSIVQGSSTITMQLARTIYPELLPLEEKTLRRKILEIRVAREIEDKYSKTEILELYLNHVYLGRNMNGVENAAQEYFGVSVRRLTLAQSAMLAAMVKAPAFYDPRRNPDSVRERRDLVLKMMGRQKRLPEDVLAAAKKAPLGVASSPPDRRIAAGLAPYFVEQVRQRLGSDVREPGKGVPSSIRTTIDARIQRAAEEELQAQLEAIEKGIAGKFAGPRYDPTDRTPKTETEYLQGAVVVIDARQGDVLAWVGGRDFTQSRFDRVAEARRQAGSAFKPFVYSAAIAGGWSLSKPLDDSPVKIKLDAKRNWTPRNVRGRHEGTISLRNALVRSNNTATVRLAEDIGMDAIAAAARHAGLRVDNVNPSLTLGAIHVTPLELTSAYSAFANAGTRVEPRMILQVEDEAGNLLSKPGVEKRRSIDAGTAYLLTDVLTDAITQGTGKAAKPKRADVAVAGKTGTTNDVTDAWFIGYTPDIVAGVWIGFDRQRPIVDEATAARLAAPVWGSLIDRIYDDRAIPQPWNMPDGVRKYSVDVASGLPLGAGCRAARVSEELFVASRVPPADCAPAPAAPKVLVVRRDDPGTTVIKMPPPDFAPAPVGPPPAVSSPPVPSRQVPSRKEEPGREDRAREDSEVVIESPRPKILPPLIYDARSPDLSGSWTLTTEIRSTAVPEFRNMRLGYQIELAQQGGRVFGQGRKLSENGRPIPGAARTAIELNGTVYRDHVTLSFRERGTRRSSGGMFSFSVSPDSRGLGGTFRSDAANTSGVAVAKKLQ
jgi:penicillin-binding protein 1A